LYCTAGQEESKVDIEDGIRFTPFNLKEEYEEGEFDADGMYIFKKNKVCTMMPVKGFNCHFLQICKIYNSTAYLSAVFLVKLHIFVTYINSNTHTPV